MLTPEETAEAEKAKAEQEAKEAAEKAAAEAQDKKDEFEKWLDQQPQNVKDAYTLHTNGLTSALEKERASAKTAKENARKLADFEAKEAERKQAEMTEMERLNTTLADEQKKRQETEKALSAIRTENGIAAIAQSKKLNFTDFRGDILPKIDLSAIEYDDTGNPTEQSVLPQLERLAKDKPYLLLKTAAPSGNITNPGTNAGHGGETDADRRKRLGI